MLQQVGTILFLWMTPTLWTPNGLTRSPVVSLPMVDLMVNRFRAVLQLWQVLVDTRPAHIILSMKWKVLVPLHSGTDPRFDRFIAAGLRLLQVFAPERAHRLTLCIRFLPAVLRWMRTLTLRWGEEVARSLLWAKTSPSGPPAP